MFFKKAKFFLDLTGDDTSSNGKGTEKAPVVAAVIAPVAPLDPVATAEAPAAVAAAAVAPGTTTAAPTTAAASAAAPTAVAVATAARTTAEEIAAELAAAQANRPPASTVTFAPDCLVPGASLPLRRRTAGANLAGFRDIARSMMKS
jgi:phage tail sheath gpL-like